jgi:hypothetical protein
MQFELEIKADLDRSIFTCISSPAVEPTENGVYVFFQKVVRLGQRTEDFLVLIYFRRCSLLQPCTNICHFLT